LYAFLARERIERKGSMFAVVVGFVRFWGNERMCFAVSLRVVVLLSVRRLEKENARKSERVEIGEAKECQLMSGCRGCCDHIWFAPVTKQDIATAVNARKLEDNGKRDLSSFIERQVNCGTKTIT
jgi:hypothetical protein